MQEFFKAFCFNWQLKTHKCMGVPVSPLNRFISLWQEFYQKLDDADKSKLPLIPIYFLAPVI